MVPEKLIAGDTWEWRTEDGDYPAGTWTSNLYFEKSDYSFAVTGVAEGTTHTFEVEAVTSAGYPAGKYRWRLVVANAGVRKSISTGFVEVEPDPAAVGNYDHRSMAQLSLEMIEAYLRDPTNLTAANYALGGRSLSRWSRADLLVERDRWRAEVRSEEAAERIGRGLGNPRRLYVRFGRA